jgi:hypothetical protein
MDAPSWWDEVERYSRMQGYDRLGFQWSGPKFKPEHHYLTHEGYPLGTVCWYVSTEWQGERKWHCAETAAEAVRLATDYLTERGFPDA